MCSIANTAYAIEPSGGFFFPFSSSGLVATHMGSFLTFAADGSYFDRTTVWTFSMVTVTFMVYLYIGWRSRVRETQGFYVAGRGVPAIANGAATAADWMSAASFISMAGLISFAGSDGSVYLMGWTGGFVLLALLLAPYLRKFGQYTVPDFVGARYYSETARVVAAVCAIFVSFTYVAGQMRGVGIVFSRFLQVEVWQGVVVGMVIVAFFAVLGGMKGITWTQVAQFFILILAFLIPAIALSSELTGNPIPQIGMLTSDIANELNGTHQQLGFAEYTKPFTSSGAGMLDVICITLALMMGTAGLPHVIVRFYTVPDVRAARFSAGWALLFIAILYTTAPALAMFARANLLDTLNDAEVAKITIISEDPEIESEVDATKQFEFDPADVQANARYKQVLDEVQAANATAKAQQAQLDSGKTIEPEDRVYPSKVIYGLKNREGKSIDWVNSWQQTELIRFSDREQDGLVDMDAAVDEKTGRPTGQFVDATIDKDIIVLSTPEVARLAPWVIALVAAGGLAAALSTAAGLLLVISSSIAHDLYIHFIDPDAPEARRVMVGRAMIILAILFAGYFGIRPPGFVGEVVAFAFGLAAASFFPVILLGIFDERTNREGAIAGMVVGLLFTIFYITGNQWDKMLDITRPEDYVAPWYMTRWFFNISPAGIGTIGCLLNFVVTIVISRLTSPPPENIREMVQLVRLPSGAHEPEAHFDESDAEADNP